MADPGFPGQHSTTTTVKSSSTAVDTTIRFDPNYIRTIHGYLKIAEIALDLLGFICIEASGVFSYHSRGSWFNFVAMTGFWVTGILLAFYLFHIIERFYKVPWLKFELGYCALWAAFYLIAASLAVSYHVEAYIAAGFFGFCAMLVYGVDAFFKYQAIKTGQLAQGERVINKQTTTTVTTPSAYPFELGFCALWASFYLIAASLAVSMSKLILLQGFCAILVYFFKYQAIRKETACSRRKSD